jgi:hypothetical protein
MVTFRTHHEVFSRLEPLGCVAVEMLYPRFFRKDPTFAHMVTSGMLTFERGFEWERCNYASEAEKRSLQVLQLESSSSSSSAGGLYIPGVSVPSSSGRVISPPHAASAAAGVPRHASPPPPPSDFPRAGQKSTMRDRGSPSAVDGEAPAKKRKRGRKSKLEKAAEEAAAARAMASAGSRGSVRRSGTGAEDESAFTGEVHASSDDEDCQKGDGCTQELTEEQIKVLDQVMRMDNDGLDSGCDDDYDGGGCFPSVGLFSDPGSPASEASTNSKVQKLSRRLSSYKKMYRKQGNDLERARGLLASAESELKDASRGLAVANEKARRARGDLLQLVGDMHAVGSPKITLHSFRDSNMVYTNYAAQGIRYVSGGGSSSSGQGNASAAASAPLFSSSSSSPVSMSITARLSSSSNPPAGGARGGSSSSYMDGMYAMPASVRMSRLAGALKRA